MFVCNKKYCNKCYFVLVVIVGFMLVKLCNFCLGRLAIGCDGTGGAGLREEVRGSIRMC